MRQPGELQFLTREVDIFLADLWGNDQYSVKSSYPCLCLYFIPSISMMMTN